MKAQLEVLHSVASIMQRRTGQRRMLQDVLDLLETDLELHRGTIMLRSPVGDAKDMIMDALKRTQGNVNAASRQLGITARMTRYKIKKLNIDCQMFAKHKLERRS